MEIRVYKDGESKRLELTNTAAKFDQQYIDIDEFRDIYALLQNNTISIKQGGETIVRASWDDFKDKSGNALASTPRKTADKVSAILKSRTELDSYVIGDDISDKSSETIFTHQTEGAARGLGGRLIVDDNNSKLNVTRSAGQGASGLEVRVTGASGADVGSIVGTGAYSNITRDFFTATASTGQVIESSFTVHGRFIAEDGIYLGTGGGSALALTDLAEVPSSLGTSGQVLAVNSGGTGLEFVAQSGGSGGSSTFIGLTDTPSGFGSTGQVLVVNAGRNALEFSTPLQIGTSSSTALAGDTTTITTSQALAINANSSKTSFPGFGTTSGTALEGNTSLFDGAYSSLSGIPSSFTPASHSHAQSEITGLVSALAAKANTGDLSDVALSNDYDDLSNTPTTITSSQASAITANTAKTGITSSQASAITANTAKVSYTDASAVSANTAKVTFPGFGTTGGTALEGDTTLLELGTTSSTALAGNTTTITSGQASAITANTSKTGITSGQATAITANTAKVTFPGFGTSGGTALEGNTSLLQLGTTSSTALAGNTTTITAGQASAITANTAKTGITSGQASAITANTAKTGITSGQASAITANTAKTGITSGQASAITANTSKVTFPGFGTSGGTALEGDTTLLQLGTTSSTALSGDTTTITSGQASAITANTAKTGITSGQASAITANTAKTGITSGQASAITANTAKVTFPGFGTSAGTALEGDTTIPTATSQLSNDSGFITAANELDGQSIEIVTRSSAYANNTWEGEVVKFGSDTLVQNKFYVHTSSGWVAADADVEAKTKGLFGIALGTSSATDGILVKGIHSSNVHSFSAGDTLYVGTTEGTVTTTAPSAAGDFLRVVGYVLANGYIYINPSPDYIEIA